MKSVILVDDLEWSATPHKEKVTIICGRGIVDGRVLEISQWFPKGASSHAPSIKAMLVKSMNQSYQKYG